MAPGGSVSIKEQTRWQNWIEGDKMKLISWNVNGLRAAAGKGFLEYLYESGADVFCVQETKMQRGQAEFDFKEYDEYWNSAEKKGYSGLSLIHISEPTRQAEISYAVFCLKKKKKRSRMPSSALTN